MLYYIAIIIYGIYWFFTIIINLLKMIIILKLSYESSIFDVISYVCFFSGCGYIGVHPISKLGKLFYFIKSF